MRRAMRCRGADPASAQHRRGMVHAGEPSSGATLLLPLANGPTCAWSRQLVPQIGPQDARETALWARTRDPNCMPEVLTPLPGWRGERREGRREEEREGPASSPPLAALWGLWPGGAAGQLARSGSGRQDAGTQVALAARASRSHRSRSRPSRSRRSLAQARGANLCPRES